MNYNHVSADLNWGLLFDVNSVWRVHLENSHRHYFESKNQIDDSVSFVNRFLLNSDLDLRLKYEKQSQESLSLSIGYFFN